MLRMLLLRKWASRQSLKVIWLLLNLERAKYLSDNESKIIALQAAWKGYKARKSYIEKLEDFQSHENLWAKVYIFSFYRSCKESTEQIRQQKQKEVVI
jgi:hypothetical protein